MQPEKDQKLVNPHPLSWTSALTRMRFNDKELAVCTSFLYRKDGELFLVTDWHNMAARHPDTRRLLSSTGALPNNMEVCIPLSTQPTKWHYGLVQICKEDFSDPEWYEHPTHGSRVDVAVMPVTLDKGFPAPPEVHPINDYPFSNFQEEVGEEVFILGYPKAKTGGGALPIWKRGSIASEPQADLDGVPKLLVDTASREGMSGSPVIARRFGVKRVGRSEEGEEIGWIGTEYKFLGVYSGRVFKDPRPTPGSEEAIRDAVFEAQLAIVWKASVIDEIIAGKTKPKLP